MRAAIMDADEQQSTWSTVEWKRRLESIAVSQSLALEKFDAELFWSVCTCGFWQNLISIIQQ